MPSIIKNLAAAAAYGGGQPGYRVGRQPQRLAGLAHRRPRPKTDHRSGQAGMVAAVFIEDILKNLFAALMFEIDVNVGRFVARRRNKTFE